MFRLVSLPLSLSVETFYWQNIFRSKTFEKQIKRERERALLNIALDSLWQLHQYRFRLQWRHISKLRQNILIFNGPNSASFIFVLLSFSSNTNFAEKTVGFRRIWTRIIGNEGEHLTTATTEGQQKFPLWFWDRLNSSTNVKVESILYGRKIQSVPTNAAEIERYGIEGLDKHSRVVYGLRYRWVITEDYQIFSSKNCF